MSAELVGLKSQAGLRPFTGIHLLVSSIPVPEADANSLSRQALDLFLVAQETWKLLFLSFKK